MYNYHVCIMETIVLEYPGVEEAIVLCQTEIIFIAELKILIAVL